MAEIKMLAFNCSRDHLTIRGHLFDMGADSEKAVIVSHGFMATEKTVWNYAKQLARQGYTSYTFDFCGGGIGGKSDGKSEDMTVLTEKEDLLAVVRYVFRQSPSVSLMGCSQGGFVSALAAKELGNETIEKLVMFYPALCIPDDARKGKMMMYHFDPKKIPDLLGRLPMKLGGDYARSVIDMDPFEAIWGYDGKTLLVHGTADRIVPVEYSRRARMGYPHCEYHEIEGGGHGFQGRHEEEACGFLSAFMMH